MVYDVIHATTAHRATDGRIFHKIAVSTAKLGYRVMVIGPHTVAEDKLGVTICPIPTISIRLFRRILSPLIVLVRILQTRGKLVHFHDPEFIPAAMFLKLLRYKVVYDVHEYYSEIQSIRFRSPLIRRFVKSLSHLFLEYLPRYFFDVMVFPTNRLRVELGSPKYSVSLVNLLPLSQLSENCAEENRTYDLLFMGTISPFRAGPLVDMMSRILERRPNATILMLGTKSETVKWIQNHSPRNVLDAITFHRRVDHDKVNDVLSTAKIGFNYHPMEKRFEVAIPMKLYEYMACGLAVVSTHFDEVAEQFVNNEEIILLKGDDQQLFADTILKLLDDDIMRRTIAERGRNAIKHRINWEKTEMPKILTLYTSLLGLAKQEVSAP